MENSNGGVQSVARIFALIEVLCAHPKGASLQTISAESGLPKSTAHRLLSSLVSLGYAVQDSFSTHYRLTMKMFELSSGIVNDMDIINAILNHTTGKPAMTRLEKIIFVADYIEPRRNKAPNLDKIRKLAFEDLDRATCVILKSTLNYLKTREEAIDEMTLRAYEFYEKEWKKEKGNESVTENGEAGL